MASAMDVLFPKRWTEPPMSQSPRVRPRPPFLSWEHDQPLGCTHNIGKIPAKTGWRVEGERSLASLTSDACGTRTCWVMSDRANQILFEPHVVALLVEV